MPLGWDQILFGLAAALAVWTLLRAAGKRSRRDARITAAAVALVIAISGAALLLWRPSTPTSAARAASGDAQTSAAGSSSQP